MNAASSFLVSTAPLRIVVAAPAVAATYAHALVQKRVCLLGPDRGDVALYASCRCSPCMRINQHSSYEIWWLEPEKSYSVEDIEPVLQRVALSLDPGQSCTVVFAHAHLLSTVVANRLLKLFEEPPTGYQFILLTDDLDALLPTIRSRAQTFVVQGSGQQVALPPLLAYFMQQQMPDATAFEAVLKAAHLSDQQTVQYASQLLSALVAKLRVAPSTKSDLSWLQQAAEIVSAALRMPPPSGGSEFFWKLLYLDYPWSV